MSKSPPKRIVVDGHNYVLASEVSGALPDIWEPKLRTPKPKLFGPSVFTPKPYGPSGDNYPVDDGMIEFDTEETKHQQINYLLKLKEKGNLTPKQEAVLQKLQKSLK